MTKMEDGKNERRPKGKTKKREDDKNMVPSIQNITYFNSPT